MSAPDLTLVMPAFNEADNVRQAVDQAATVLAETVDDWEIVVVNDGSRDATGAILDGIAGSSNGRVRAVHHARNQGLGGALVTGFGAARGAVIAYCDSDLPFDMEVLRNAYRTLVDREVDMVTGYRLDRGNEGLQRHVYSFIYNGLVRAALGVKVRDVNFSLKMFRRAVFDREGLHSRGSFIDAELLARARRGGFSITQIPVAYTPRTRGVSTLSRPSVIVGVLYEMALYRLGRLHRPAPALVPSPAL